MSQINETYAVGNPDKGDIHDLLGSRFTYNVDLPGEVGSSSMAPIKSVYVASLEARFVYDPLDNSSLDDGSDILVSADDRRYKNQGAIGSGGAFSTSPGGSAAEISGPGTFRVRFTADDAPQDLKTFEILQVEADGQIVFRLMSDDLSIGQNFIEIDRSDKITSDKNFVDAADVDGPDNGSTDYVTSSDYVIDGSGFATGTILGENGTLTGAGNPIPANYKLWNTQPGNFELIFGNTPSNAKMVERVEFLTNLFRLGEICGQTSCGRGLILGMMKDADRDSVYANTDNTMVVQSLEDGSLIYESRMQSGNPQPHHWFVGRARKMTLDDTGYFGLGTPAPVRPFHMVSASSLVARLESTVGEALLEFKDSTTTVVVRIGSDGNDLVAKSSGTERLRVKEDGGISVDGGAIVFPDFIAVALDPPSIAANSSTVLTAAFPGVVNTTPLFISGDSGSSTIFPIGAWGSAANTASVRFRNSGTTSTDHVSRNYRIGRL